jgi:hypothetical protein
MAGSGTPHKPYRKPQVMDYAEDFTRLDDPAFLAERRRVRGQIERMPADEHSPELAERYRRLNDEFLRRASAAWAQAS